MATKLVDAAATKQRQQKIILVVGGLLLAILLVIQGPKLKNQLSGSKKSNSSAPTATTPDTSTGTTTPSTTPTTTTPATGTVTPGTASSVPTVGGQSAQVAGIVIRTGAKPQPQSGQLWSLSRFKVKDPFVQQVSPATGTSTGASTGASGYPGGTKSPSASTPKTGAVTGGAVVTPSAPAAAAEAFAYATLMVNGKPLQLQLKQLFPKAQPTFVLSGVTKRTIKIRVAGGRFTGGTAVVLELGKRVTLMNTTTGQRFIMKLVFTGSQPEQIAGFKQPAQTQTTTASTP
jgi:hypothetical protein